MMKLLATTILVLYFCVGFSFQDTVITDSLKPGNKLPPKAGADLPLLLKSLRLRHGSIDDLHGIVDKFIRDRHTAAAASEPSDDIQIPVEANPKPEITPIKHGEPISNVGPRDSESEVKSAPKLTDSEEVLVEVIDEGVEKAEAAKKPGNKLPPPPPKPQGDLPLLLKTLRLRPNSRDEIYSIINQFLNGQESARIEHEPEAETNLKDTEHRILIEN